MIDKMSGENQSEVAYHLGFLWVILTFLVAPLIILGLPILFMFSIAN